MSHFQNGAVSVSAGTVTDGGMETDLIFNHGVELPEFAAYPLVRHPSGRALLAQCYSGYAEVARAAGARLALESPTWRANSDWGARLGDDAAALRHANITPIEFLRDLASGWEDLQVQVVGMIGPRGDGYAAGPGVDADTAAAYHRPQVEALASAGVDQVTAYTLTDLGEALGVVRAAADCRVPVGVAFTVETDGRLPGGGDLGQAFAALLRESADVQLLLNCAHPSHLVPAVAGLDDELRARVVGVRANASAKSHAELDEAQELDSGDIGEFVESMHELAEMLPRLDRLGGCCGTDVRHVAALWNVSAAGSGGRDDLNHDAVLQPLGPVVGEAQTFVEPASPVVQERR